jgi:hypothetical protein
MTSCDERDSDETAPAVIFSFEWYEAALAAVARLRAAGFADEHIQFAMRGARQPKRISRVGDRETVIVAGHVGAFVGMVMGAAFVLLGQIVLHSVVTWALPAGMLVGLCVGGLVGQELARRKPVTGPDPAHAPGVQEALRHGRAVVVVLAGSRGADAARVLGTSTSAVAVSPACSPSFDRLRVEGSRHQRLPCTPE